MQVLKVEEGGREGDMMTKQGRTNVRLGGLHLPLLTWQRQGGSPEPRGVGVSRSWKMQGSRFFPGACGQALSLPTL